MPDNLPEFDPNDDELTEPRISLDAENEPPIADDDTDDLDPRLLKPMLDPDDENDVPFHLPKTQTDESTLEHHRQPNSAPTMPHFREPGVTDPRITLPGTGGLDPNPDMQPYQSEPTMKHIPRVQGNESTLQNPKYAAPRPQQAQAAQGRYVPPPNQRQQQSGGKQPMRPLPQRRGRRRIMGLRPGCVYMFLGLLLTFCGGSFLLVAGAAAIFVPRIEAEWNTAAAQLDEHRPFESTFFYDRYGNQLYKAIGEGERVVVPYSRFPQNLINATVAIEDDSFFSNIGIDIGATLVATMQYVTSEADAQTPGGSTITQQLVRNVLFDFERRSERSVERKLEEIMLAIAVTARRSKEDILGMYLNEIYYGNLSYGAQAASQTFFGKDVQDLTLGEAALLAGLPQSPADLDPLNPNPEVQVRVFERWRQVLQEMLEEGYITQAEMDDALRGGLNYALPDENELGAPHFTVYAQSEFERLMTGLGYSEEDIARGGFEIYTTVDQSINEMVQNAAANQVASLTSRNASNAAAVAIQPTTGEIVAMVGSIDYYSNVIDGRVNVSVSLRQPGSTMKPFTYAAALERGMTAGDVIWDTRTDINIAGQPTYTPRNYDGGFHGPMNLRRALANSYNIPPVQIVRLIGVDYLLNMLQRVGITTLTDPSRYGISLTLGGGEVSLLEFTNAYGVFANQGAQVEPTSIRCILDNSNNIIYQYENGCPLDATFTSNTIDTRGFGVQVMDPRIAYIITDILGDNTARTPEMGSNSALYTAGIPTSAKTGTTDDRKDNWTIGYTRNVVVGVWVGNNDGQPMVGSSSGLSNAAPIWNTIMRTIYSNQGMLDVFRVDGQLVPDNPSAPGGMSQRQICDVRSITDPSTTCPRRVLEWFLDGPAGVPDGTGNLTFPQQPSLTGELASTSTMQEISPDVFRVLAFPIPPAIAAGIQFPIQPGELPPPAPKYCRVPESLASQAIGAGAQEFIFIAGPLTSQSDAVRAEEYARQANLAYLPTIECVPELLVGGAGSYGAAVTTAVITTPANGASYRTTDSIVIAGTVQFDNSQADFFHLDIIGGPFGNWTSLGEEGYSSVINGTLWVLDPYALQAGNYRVRVRLVKNGDFIQQPYEVAFTVTG